MSAYEESAMDATDVKSYCESLRQDLTVWKAKIYDIVRALNKMPSDKKAKVMQSVDDLHTVVDDIDGRIERLERECPVEWGPEKIALEERLRKLQTTCELVWPDVSPDDLE
jgi:hypothetical protein